MLLRPQITLLILSVCLIAAMYQLPKVVVDNKDKVLAKDKSAADAPDARVAQAHTQALSREQRDAIARLKSVLQGSKDATQQAAITDSLAGIFRIAAQFDSAAYYVDLGASYQVTPQRLRRAADAYYEAFQFAVSVDTKKSKQLAEQTRTRYEKILAANPKDYAARANLAMTYTVSDNPMQGIRQLRDILAEDSNNQLAITNLGLLSMQSGQYLRAVEWFEKLLKINPNHWEAKLYLAQAYQESGKKSQAQAILASILDTQADSLAAYRATATELKKQWQ